MRLDCGVWSWKVVWAVPLIRGAVSVRIHALIDCPRQIDKRSPGLRKIGLPRFVKSGVGIPGGLFLCTDDSSLMTSLGGTLGTSSLDKDDARDCRDAI